MSKRKRKASAKLRDADAAAMKRSLEMAHELLSDVLTRHLRDACRKSIHYRMAENAAAYTAHTLRQLDFMAGRDFSTWPSVDQLFEQRQLVDGKTLDENES